MSFFYSMREKLLEAWKQHSILILIFCLVFGIRFVYTLFVQIKFGGQAFLAFSDANAYVLLAQNLLDRGVFSVMQVSPWISDSLRTPLYPFVIAGFFWAKIPIGSIIIVNKTVVIFCFII